MSKISFTCSKCFKALHLQEHVYKKAYEGHDTCLSCRTVDIADNVLTEEELKDYENTMFDYGYWPVVQMLESTINSHRTLNSRNASLVHENDELMAENEKLKHAIFNLDAHIDFSFPPEPGELMEFKDVSGIAQAFKEAYRIVNKEQAAINEALEEINHE